MGKDTKVISRDLSGKKMRTQQKRKKKQGETAKKDADEYIPKH